MLRAFVKGHDDVSAKTDLRGDGAFCAEEVGRSIQVRAKLNAFLCYFAQIAKTENLKAPGVGEDRTVPRHEFLRVAKPANGVHTGTKIEMISIVQQNLNAEFLQGVLPHAFNRGNRAYWHED